MSQYKDIKERIRIADHKVKAIGIDWRLLVYMEQSNKRKDRDDKIENTGLVSIGVYLYADVIQDPMIQ